MIVSPFVIYNDHLSKHRAMERGWIEIVLVVAGDRSMIVYRVTSDRLKSIGSQKSVAHRCGSSYTDAPIHFNHVILFRIGAIRSIRCAG